MESASSSLARGAGEAATPGGAASTLGELEPFAASRIDRVVTLVSDSIGFAQSWEDALELAGLEVRTAPPASLPHLVEKGALLVIDGDAEAYDDDELLAHVGLARALGAVPVVSLQASPDGSSIGDILDDLCAGLVARNREDHPRLASLLVRRCDADRGRRFEYVTVSPRGDDVLAIFSDGNAVLVPRPVVEEDDGSDVESISLEDDATRAVLSLASGVVLELTANLVAQRAASADANPEVDGVKLGKRIRELRLAAGLTQAELARRTGIHRPNIARVEAGRHTPSLETLARLATAIGVPTTRVLG
jgi:DNA-binding XRE family transcriptional regulator